MLRKLNFFTFALLVLSTTTMLGCRSDNSDSRLPLDELSAGTEQDGSAGGEGSGDSDESTRQTPTCLFSPRKMIGMAMAFRTRTIHAPVCRALIRRCVMNQLIRTAMVFPPCTRPLSRSFHKT